RKMSTAERGKRRRSARWACGPSQLRLSGGRPTGRFLLTLTLLHRCIISAKADRRRGRRAAGLLIFPTAPRCAFIGEVSFRPLAEVTANLQCDRADGQDCTLVRLPTNGSIMFEEDQRDEVLLRDGTHLDRYDPECLRSRPRHPRKINKRHATHVS